MTCSSTNSSFGVFYRYDTPGASFSLNSLQRFSFSLMTFFRRWKNSRSSRSA
jgi:hypothetical protein